ncbi:hypothetical protein [Gilvibacter sp.]|uniref:hypothetical protein n=1 Tax=Gilvibacter sp. TaxID=2729997 RepID=UPI003B5224A0
MKTIQDFKNENKEINAFDAGKIYAGITGSSYWSTSSGTCTTHYHDTWDDANGDGVRNAGESGSLCIETTCEESCVNT